MTGTGQRVRVPGTGQRVPGTGYRTTVLGITLGTVSIHGNRWIFAIVSSRYLEAHIQSSAS